MEQTQQLTGNIKMNNSVKSRLHIYGCGGFGLNIIQDHLNIPESPGFATIEISVIDSSKSDVRTSLNGKEFNHHFIPGVDGSGKDRNLGATNIRPEIETFLQKYKPGVFNVVIFSGAGGTGSVAGPLIVRELMERGENVIVFMVGSTSCGSEATNTYSTLRGLQNLPKELKRGLAMSYYQNTNNEFEGDGHGGFAKRMDVDINIEKDLRAFALLVSNGHIALDTEDLVNFLDFTNVVKGVPARLVELNFSSNLADFDNYQGKVLTTASLRTSNDGEQLVLGQPYECAGVFSDAVIKKNSWNGDEGIKDIHFVTTAVYLPSIQAGLKESVAIFNDTKKSLVGLGVIEDDDDDMDGPDL